MEKPNEKKDSGVKEPEKGIADRLDYLFLSRYVMYTLRLWPAKYSLDAQGIRRLSKNAVICRFRGGRFILDDTFRREHYEDRKLTDKIVLERMASTYGYKDEFWFGDKITKAQSSEMNDALGKLKFDDKIDPEMKKMISEAEG